MRRSAERMYGTMLLGRQLLVGCVVLLLLVAAGWASWSLGRDALAGGRQRGTLTVASCDGTTCRGTFNPGARSVVIRQTDLADVQTRPGASVGTVLRPGGDEVLRDGAAGLLWALLPLGGALLLGGAITGGVLRLRKLAWSQLVLGAGVVVTAFVCGQ